MSVNPVEFAAIVIGGVAVGALIALFAFWMLTDNTDVELIRALSAAVRRLAEDLGKNKERENDEENEQ